MKFEYRGIIKGEIREIKPNIFAVMVKNQYDRAMLFCRYQEYYESPIKELRGNFVSMETLMRVYTKKHSQGCFTYPDDWRGFNIPSKILEECYNKITYSVTFNAYDEIMKQIIYFCGKYKNPYYLIGVDSFKSTILKHETAHGLYYTNDQYRLECQKLIHKMIDKGDYTLIKKRLVKMGYTSDKTIIDDEIQAYLSTGLAPELKSKKIIKHRKVFIKNFKKYT